MIAIAFIAAVASQAQHALDTVFACQYFRNQQEAGDGWVHVVDLRIVRRSNYQWALERANQRPVIATTFRAKLENAGGSLGLRWQDSKGKTKVAFIRFSDVGEPDRLEYFWLGFDRASVWPGYGCQSLDKDLSGAGA